MSAMAVISNVVTFSAISLQSLNVKEYILYIYKLCTSRPIAYTFKNLIVLCISNHWLSGLRLSPTTTSKIQDPFNIWVVL